MDLSIEEARIAVAGMDAVMLCGGRGRRLQPLTNQLPKPMVRFHGKPMLDHIIDFLSRKGLNRYTFCVGYMGDMIRNHYAGKSENAEMKFSDAGEDASMIMRLNKAAGSVGDRFLCVYGDTFIDLDLVGMYRAHCRAKADVTIVMTKVRSPFGLVRTDDDGMVALFEEKPVMNYYIGCFLAERAVFDNLDPRLLALPDGQGLVELFQQLVTRHKLGAFEHAGLQLTFNTPSDCEKVEEELGQFYTLDENRTAV
jgi:NDP-sugar pyrophosphorylase family protein